MQTAIQLGVLAHSIAVAADIDQVAVMRHSVDQGRADRVIAENLALLLEAIVGGERSAPRSNRCIGYLFSSRQSDDYLIERGTPLLSPAA